MSGRRERREQSKEMGSGRGQKRPLAHGDLRLLVLSLLDQNPRHGYDLIRDIEARTNGAYKPSPGVMYPALDGVEASGWVMPQPLDGKKIYHLTEAGRAKLVEETAAIAEIYERLDRAANPPVDENDDVRTALRRLRHTAMKRIREDDGDKYRDAIAATIEAARKQIEDLD